MPPVEDSVSTECSEPVLVFLVSGLILEGVAVLSCFGGEPIQSLEGLVPVGRLGGSSGGGGKVGLSTV